jgi:hypothetical protein
MPNVINLVIYDPGKTDDVVHAWAEAGIRGMTLLDSTGLAHHLGEHNLRDDLPLFPSLRSLTRATERHSRFLISVVPDSYDVENLIRATERVLGPLTSPDSGILFIVPATRVVGVRGVDVDPHSPTSGS